MILRAAESCLPEDERRQAIPAGMLAQGGAAEHAAEWSRWDWLAFFGLRLCIGLMIGAGVAVVIWFRT